MITIDCLVAIPAVALDLILVLLPPARSIHHSSVSISGFANYYITRGKSNQFFCCCGGVAAPPIECFTLY
jgi:hypothetical protein